VLKIVWCGLTLGRVTLLFSLLGMLPFHSWEKIEINIFQQGGTLAYYSSIGFYAHSEIFPGMARGGSISLVFKINRFWQLSASFYVSYQECCAWVYNLQFYNYLHSVYRSVNSYPQECEQQDMPYLSWDLRQHRWYVGNIWSPRFAWDKRRDLLFSNGSSSISYNTNIASETAICITFCILHYTLTYDLNTTLFTIK
jgi:hypothetical protein